MLKSCTSVIGMLIGIVVANVISAAYFAYLWAGSNDVYNGQASIVDSLNRQTPYYRQVAAYDLLELHTVGLGPGALNDSDFLGMVQYVSQNGSEASVSYTPLTWHLYFHEYMPPMVLVCFVLTSLALSRAYVKHSRKHRHYLADLPWRTWWVPAFVLSVPLLWVPFAVSAVRMRRKPPVYEAPKVRKKRDRVSDIPGAQAAFFQMRELGTREGIRRLIDMLEGEQKAAKGECQDLVEKLRAQQRKQLELKGQLARLHDEDSRPIVAPTPQALEQEFNRLIQLPGVEGVRPLGSSTNALAIRVRASVVHGLHRYYLGTWEIQLKLSGVVEGVEKESGVLPSWKSSGPVYRVGRKFCFGDFDDPISYHLIKGEVLEAAALAVQAVNNINPEDRHRIPEAFQCLGRVDKEEQA